LSSSKEEKEGPSSIQSLGRRKKRGDAPTSNSAVKQEKRKSTKEPSKNRPSPEGKKIGTERTSGLPGQYWRGEGKHTDFRPALKRKKLRIPQRKDKTFVSALTECPDCPTRVGGKRSRGWLTTREGEGGERVKSLYFYG